MERIPIACYDEQQAARFAEARKRMVRYWIDKGFSEKIVNIFYGSRTPEQHEIIINCRNTEEALKKLSSKIGG